MKPSYNEIREKFGKGNVWLVATYLADDIQWNIAGESSSTEKEQVL